MASNIPWLGHADPKQAFAEESGEQDRPGQHFLSHTDFHDAEPVLDVMAPGAVPSKREAAPFLSFGKGVPAGVWKGSHPGSMG